MQWKQLATFHITPIDPPLSVEVKQKAIKSTQPRKAPDCGRITTDMLKAGGEGMLLKTCNFTK